MARWYPFTSLHGVISQPYLEKLVCNMHDKGCEKYIYNFCQKIERVVSCDTASGVWIFRCLVKISTHHRLLLLRFLAFVFISTVKYEDGTSRLYPSTAVQFATEYRPVIRRCAALVTGNVKVIPLHVMKAYRGMETQLFSFLTSVINANEQSTSGPASLPSPKSSTYPLTRRLKVPQHRLDVLKEKNLSP